jgi:hypothetical protein
MLRLHCSLIEFSVAKMQRRAMVAGCSTWLERNHPLKLHAIAYVSSSRRNRGGAGNAEELSTASAADEFLVSFARRLSSGIKLK